MFLGLALMATGLVRSGWCLLMIWLGIDFFVLGIAHFKGAHRIFGKRPDGTLPLWSWAIFLPLFIYTATVWYLSRLLSREPAQNKVTDDLVIGRRLLPHEIDGKFANYVDLTAEFQEPPAIRRLPAYRSLPILDGSAPAPEILDQMLARLSPGRTFIHCAQGHGRTGLFTLALLLKTGAVSSVNDGLEKLRSVRPGVRLSAGQRRCIEQFAAHLKEGGQ
jgi:hypothetical protein